MLIQKFHTTLTSCKGHVIRNTKNSSNAVPNLRALQVCNYFIRTRTEHGPLWSMTYHARINVLQYDQLQKNPTSLFCLPLPEIACKSDNGITGQANRMKTDYNGSGQQIENRLPCRPVHIIA